MQQELALLAFPILVSFLSVSCLKSHFRFKGDHSDAHRDDAYVKSVPAKADVVLAPKKTKKKSIKPEKKAKKPKKTAKLFVFNKKVDEKPPAAAISTDLSLDLTQTGSNSDDDEHESPIVGSWNFSDEQESLKHEELGKIRIIPPQPSGYVETLKAKVRDGRRGKKSPQDYMCSDEEDSLFNVESLQVDPLTVQSSKSAIPLDIQDSRLLRINQRLGYKKSHTVYPSRDTSSDSSLDVTLRDQRH